MRGRIVSCRCCGKTGLNAGHGWVKACYKRWFRAGKPTGGPPPAQAGNRAAIAAKIAQAAGRFEDYVWLREAQGLSLDAAAERVGISHRHAQRYEAARLAQQKVSAAA